MRGWAFYARDDVERWDAKTATFVLEPGEYRSEYGGVARINSAGFVGRELESDGPDLWRIAAVGDSCTYGGGSDSDSYPALLAARLRLRAGPGRRYEVVNAGISGLNSRARPAAPAHAGCCRCAPDVVTLYIGWNDLMKFDPLAQVAPGQDARWSGVARALDDLWLVKGLRKLLFFYLRGYLAPPATGPESRSRRLRRIPADRLRTQPGRDDRRGAQRGGAAPARDPADGGARRHERLRPAARPRDVPVLPLRLRRGRLPRPAGRLQPGGTLARAGRGTCPLVDLAQHFETLDDSTLYFFDTMHPDKRGREQIAEQLLAGLDRAGLLAPGHEARP